MCLKRTWCCSFHGLRNFGRQWFLGCEHLWRAPVRNQLKRSILNFCTHISNRLLYKTMSAFFLTTSYSFVLIIRQVLKAYFAWKQLKIDYSKNTWKEWNCGHGFVCPLVGYILVKKNDRKLQLCWCRIS